MGERAAEGGLVTQYVWVQATKFTPLKLLYGEEAMTLEELKHGSCRVHSPEELHEDMKTTIDSIKVVKIQAAINLGKYQDETRRWRNKKVVDAH